MSDRARILVIGVVAIVLAAVVFYLARKPSTSAPLEPSKDTKFNPVSDAAPKPTSTVSPLEAKLRDAGVSPQDYRLWNQGLDRELCPKAGEQFNKLADRAPTDPKALNQVSLCLQYGNALWYKCILEAKDEAAAQSCSARFLQPPDL